MAKKGEESQLEDVLPYFSTKLASFRDLLSLSLVSTCFRARLLLLISSLCIHDIESTISGSRLVDLLNLPHFHQLESLTIDTLHIANVDDVLLHLGTSCRSLLNVDIRCFFSTGVCSSGLNHFLQSCSSLESLTLIAASPCGFCEPNDSTRILFPALELSNLTSLNLQAHRVSLPALPWLPALQSLVCICQRLTYPEELGRVPKGCGACDSRGSTSSCCSCPSRPPSHSGRVQADDASPAAHTRPPALSTLHLRLCEGALDLLQAAAPSVTRLKLEAARPSPHHIGGAVASDSANTPQNMGLVLSALQRLTLCRFLSVEALCLREQSSVRREDGAPAGRSAAVAWPATVRHLHLDDCAEEGLLAMVERVAGGRSAGGEGHREGLLQSLSLSYCRALRALPLQLSPACCSLRQLHVSSCCALTAVSLPACSLLRLASLRLLHCPRLASVALVGGAAALPCLQEVELQGCPDLEQVAEELLGRRFGARVEIIDCPKLTAVSGSDASGERDTRESQQWLPAKNFSISPEGEMTLTL